MSSLDDLPAGDYLLSKLPDGHRVWNIEYLTTEATGNDAGHPTELLRVYFQNLNDEVDRSMEVMLQEEETDE